MPRFSILILVLASMCRMEAPAQNLKPTTYCNPVNIDYGYTPIPDFATRGHHRTTADPVITLFKDKYFLFSTNQWGYWWSEDMSSWNFVPRKFLKPWHEVYDELCAPGILILGDTFLVIGSTHGTDFPLWMSTDPVTDSWTEAVNEFQGAAWDPAFFKDDDGRIYLYYGSSNYYPIYGTELDRKTLQPMGERLALISLQDSIHGWERFGEYADNTYLDPFIEGAWMNKYNGKYYLQYAAPGTEFSGYADGVYVGSGPLGPFVYQEHNPFSYKPGGFVKGAGHGATFQDRYDHWWHVSTVVVGVKNNFERRIGIWPAAFDEDDMLYTNTSYGDYPHYLPDAQIDYDQSLFTGWMLLNYHKPVRVSSTLGGYYANNAVDEDIKTYWSAETGEAGEWFQTDLGELSKIRAVQVNFADQDADCLGKPTSFFHQYRILGSADEKNWFTVIDKSENREDVPHDYVQLDSCVEARYLKIINYHMPTGKFALSGFRIFGIREGSPPGPVEEFAVLRGEHTHRNAWIKWKNSTDATGYVIYTGIHPDKLYNSIMVYGRNEHYFPAMDLGRTYYFQIEAFNESGIGERSKIIKAE
jgi:xylan 1,4-beta-xylosidase